MTLTVLPMLTRFHSRTLSTSTPSPTSLRPEVPAWDSFSALKPQDKILDKNFAKAMDGDTVQFGMTVTADDSSGANVAERLAGFQRVAALEPNEFVSWLLFERRAEAIRLLDSYVKVQARMLQQEAVRAMALFEVVVNRLTVYRTLTPEIVAKEVNESLAQRYGDLLLPELRLTAKDTKRMNEIFRKTLASLRDQNTAGYYPRVPANFDMFAPDSQRVFLWNNLAKLRKALSQEEVILARVYNQLNERDLRAIPKHSGEFVSGCHDFLEKIADADLETLNPVEARIVQDMRTGKVSEEEKDWYGQQHNVYLRETATQEGDTALALMTFYLEGVTLELSGIGRFPNRQKLNEKVKQKTQREGQLIVFELTPKNIEKVLGQCYKWMRGDGSELLPEWPETGMLSRKFRDVCALYLPAMRQALRQVEDKRDQIIEDLYKARLKAESRTA